MTRPRIAATRMDPITESATGARIMRRNYRPLRAEVQSGMSTQETPSLN
jgi:hypothetical protein